MPQKRTCGTRFLVVGVLIIGLMCIMPASATVSFQVYSNPSGAEVNIDNFWFDQTPATICCPASGWHTIRVTKDGFLPSLRSEYCDDAGNPSTTCVVSFDLAPKPVAFGWLDINPFGAQLWIDGIYEGAGAMTIPLAPGSHSMTLKKPGYYDYTETFTISAGQTTSKAPGMTPYPQQPKYGSLQIVSYPGGAGVYVNNEYKGLTLPDSTAFYVTDLLPGTYTLKLVMPDYQTYTDQVRVDAGIVNDIWATLQPNTPGPSPDTTGQVYAYSTPAGANVYLDNAYKGITPLTLKDIPAGSHTITYKMNGFQDYSTVANVVGGTIINAPAALKQGTSIPTTVQPQPTRSPVSTVTILSAISICAIGAALFRKK